MGPPLDRADFDVASYQETLKTLAIPPLPDNKPLPRRPSSTDRASSPSLRILGSSPWKSYQQDPNRPPPSPDHELEDAHMHAAIAQAMNKLDLKESSWRFHGKASPHHLIMTLNELRHAAGGKNLLEGLSANKRKEYWQVPEWEVVIAQEGVRPVNSSLWPDESLAQELIDAYFTHVNFHLPLLIKPVFEKHYRSRLHHNHRDFAKVCLMVFANGSRFTDNDAVYWPRNEAMTDEGKQRLRDDEDGTLRYSAGWKYLREVFRMGRSVMQGPNLFDFQSHVLICAFLLGSAVPHLTWLLSGLGLRAAQEIGIHVRSVLLHADPVERALFSRCFWALYHIDRLNCAAIGRSVAIQDTDFDADYPIDVDDEFFEDDTVQVPGVGITRVSAFIHTLKLDHIIGAALRTIYAINQLPEHRADTTAQRANVIELDSALNAWADAVPDGLRWDPTRADQQLFEQSAVLYVYYYYCQILVHRPFIPTLKHSESVGLPALAICSNASRSICNIVDTVLRRGRQSGLLPGRILNVHLMLPVWIASIVLLIGIYTGRQQPAERDRAMADFRKCLAAMREMELIWRQAGKLTDVLSEIAQEMDAADAPTPPTQGEKRSTSPIINVAQETLFDPSIFDSLLKSPDGVDEEWWSQLFPPEYQ